MSWQSTIPYYQLINQHIVDTLSGLHPAKIVIYSVDFSEIEHCQFTDNWDKSAEILADAAHKLELTDGDFARPKQSGCLKTTFFPLSSPEAA